MMTTEPVHRLQPVEGQGRRTGLVLAAVAALLFIGGIAVAMFVVGGDDDGEEVADSLLESKDEAQAKPGADSDASPKTNTPPPEATPKKVENKEKSTRDATKEPAAKSGEKGDDMAVAKVTPEPDMKVEPVTKNSEPAITRPLPNSTWGTNEAVLLASLSLPPPAPVEPPPESAPEPPPTREPAPRPVRKPPPRRTPRPTRVTRKPPPRRTPAPPRETTNGSRGSSGAKSKAASLYKQRKFSEAASVLRSAARSASRGEAKSLRSTASNYSAVGSGLAKGSGEAVSAATALSKALAADRRAGSVHQSLIKAKLRLYAPKAAKSKLARKDWVGARRMADLAAAVGASSSVRPVRAKLESTAGQLFNSAVSASKSGNKKKARKLLKQVTSMVPSSSRWHRKARSGLAKL